MATLRIPLSHQLKIPAPWSVINRYYHRPKRNDASFNTGQPFLPHSRVYSTHSTIPLRRRLPLPYPPLLPLFQPRPPPHPFHLSTTNMTSSTPVSAQAPSDPSVPPSPKTARVVIKGRVQGVFYRDWTVENATQLGLKGWVRNRRDGSVEALFSGASDKVQEMEQRCRRGPPDAMVTGLQVFPSDDDPGTRFERKPTV